MTRGVPKGTRIGGRQKGTPNKRTIEKLRQASEQVGEIRRSSQKKATEVLNELMMLAMNYAARHHNKLMASANANQPFDPLDYERFVEGMELAGTFAKNLAPYQDPTFSTIKVTMPAPEPVVDAATAKGKVLVIDDAAAATRVYQQMVRRIA
jgi:hypothetical protein